MNVMEGGTEGTIHNPPIPPLSPFFHPLPFLFGINMALKTVLAPGRTFMTERCFVKSSVNVKILKLNDMSGTNHAVMRMF
jgi:hypothetical protein